MNDELR